VVCFLWHCPAGHPGWALPTTVLCGVRTFLDRTSARPRSPDRILYPANWVAIIHLRPSSPAAWCDLPGGSGEQPSNASAGARGALLILLPVGFTEPPQSPGALVVSYTAVSPLPPRRVGSGAVCFLWHCPAGHPGWALPTTVLCGVRTFLDRTSARPRSGG
jgi:hypothetical protein